MKNLRIARRYAKALMIAAGELRKTQAVSEDMEAIGRLVRESREFRLLIDSPVVSAAKKIEVLRALLGTRVSQETLSFLLLLTSKRREDMLPEIIQEFLILHDQQLGIVEVHVKSTVELAGKQEKALQNQLEKYTKKDVRMLVELDPSLKGGLIIQIGDTVLDASMRHQLLLLKGRFLAGTPLS